MKSGSPRPRTGVVTATFPSSRPATDKVHGTGPQAPSQVLGRHRLRAVHSCLIAIIQELDGDQHPAPSGGYQTDECDAARISVRAMSDEVGLRRYLTHVLEAEAEPRGPSLLDVGDSFGVDAHSPLDPNDASGEVEMAWNVPSDLGVSGILVNPRAAYHVVGQHRVPARRHLHHTIASWSPMLSARQGGWGVGCLARAPRIGNHLKTEAAGMPGGLSAESETQLPVKVQ